MTDFYAQLVEKSGFDEALVRRALNFVKNIDKNTFSRLFFDAQKYRIEKTGVLCFNEPFYPFEFYENLKTLGLPIEKAALYVYIFLLEQAFTDHNSRKLCENIFFDTLKRLSTCAKVYFADNGDDGIYDYHFLANHVRGSVINLCGFEYQYGKHKNKKAIILHLPDRADLSKDKRLKSYRLAREYFGTNDIIADSWLLYPENKKMLSKDSRIVDFMDDFDIISEYETTDYSELFHVFGRLRDFSYENLPKKTSLQTAYAERVKNNLPIGSGVGKLKY